MTTPPITQATVGFPASAAWWNAQAYTPLSFLFNPPMCFLYASATQTLTTSGTSYLMNIDTALFDPYSGYASHAWVVPVTGWYDLDGAMHIAGNSSGNRACWFTTDKVGLTMLQGTERFTPPGSSTQSVSCSGVAHLTQGDTLALAGYQSSGGSLSTVLVSNVCATIKARFVHA